MRESHTPSNPSNRPALGDALIGAITLAVVVALCPLVLAAVFYGVGFAARAFHRMCAGF